MTLQIPITVLTGWSAWASACLLDRIALEGHGHRLALIRPPRTGQGGHGHFNATANGCMVCETSDPGRAIGELAGLAASANVSLDRLIVDAVGIDTTVMPGLFFTEAVDASPLMLDTIVALLDMTALPALEARNAAVSALIEQADTVLVSMAGMTPASRMEGVMDVIKACNPAAAIRLYRSSADPVASLLNLRMQLGALRGR